jgi:hypothetical protein
MGHPAVLLRRDPLCRRPRAVRLPGDDLHPDVRRAGADHRQHPGRCSLGFHRQHPGDVCRAEHGPADVRRSMAAGDADRRRRRQHAGDRLGRRGRPDGVGARRLYLWLPPEMDLGNRPRLCGKHCHPHVPECPAVYRSDVAAADRRLHLPPAITSAKIAATGRGRAVFFRSLYLCIHHHMGSISKRS